MRYSILSTVALTAILLISSHTHLLAQTSEIQRPTAQFKSQFFPPGTPLETIINAALPKPEEEAYRTIPWRLDLSKAREEAHKAKKPLFIWLMDGHPLCAT